MEKIFITTQTGQKVEVGVVRLFKHNETVFFIYTLSEKDTNNYVKLYVTKVNMSNLQSVVIVDENEWASFKDIMKTIIKNNRNNVPLEITDLDSKIIENITVYDPKVFKLSEEMTNFLQMNINLSNNVGEVAPAVPQSVVPGVFDTPVNNANIEVSQPTVNNTVVDVSSLSGDISANPEPAGMIEQTINQEVSTPIVDTPSTEVAQELVTQSIALNETENSIMPATPQNIEAPIVNESISVVDNDIDYKVAYLEEQLKVESLNTKVATLEAQIKLLEQKISQIKSITE